MSETHSKWVRVESSATRGWAGNNELVHDWISIVQAYPPAGTQYPPAGSAPYPPGPTQAPYPSGPAYPPAGGVGGGAPPPYQAQPGALPPQAGPPPVQQTNTTVVVVEKQVRSLCTVEQSCLFIMERWPFFGRSKCYNPFQLTWNIWEVTCWILNVWISWSYTMSVVYRNSIFLFLPVVLQVGWKGLCGHLGKCPLLRVIGNSTVIVISGLWHVYWSYQTLQDIVWCLRPVQVFIHRNLLEPL